MSTEFQCPMCGEHRPVDPFSQFCPGCRSPMLIVYDDVQRAFHKESSGMLERYRDFLPLDAIHASLGLGEGHTPLQRLDRLMCISDGPEVFAKNEIFNPTASFKDRGTVVAVHAAEARRIRRIGTVSTGNMGISTAAYGARAGIKTFVMIKTDSSREKLFSAGIHGAELIQVGGDYGRLFELSLELGGKHGIYFMNSTDALRVEGYKLEGFEIFEQMGDDAPDWIFVPVSSGGHLIGLMKAFKELRTQGMIDRLPRFVGVQARGCRPVARAFQAGAERFTRIEKVETVAQSITNPSPPAGDIVLKWIRENDGEILDVTDSDILEAQRNLAELEGIFCLPASAVTLAGMRRLAQKQAFRPGDRVVLVITGSGAKNVNILDRNKMRIVQSDLVDLGDVIRERL